MTRPRRLIDISVPLVEGMPTYPGNPEFQLRAVKRVADGGSSNVSRISIGTHTGTHVDAPRHFFDDGISVERLALDVLIGRARILEFTRPGGISRTDLAAHEVAGDLRVLLKTPNSALWTTSAFKSDYAHLTEDGAEYLVQNGIKLVGIDYLSIEQFRKPGAPAHRALLSAGVVIIEGLNLSDVTPGTCELYCLPLRVRDADAAPARVVVQTE